MSYEMFAVFQLELLAKEEKVCLMRCLLVPTRAASKGRESMSYEMFVMFQLELLARKRKYVL